MINDKPSPQQVGTVCHRHLHLHMHDFPVHPELEQQLDVGKTRGTDDKGNMSKFLSYQRWDWFKGGSVSFQVFVNEASQRIALNLGALRNSTQLGNFKSMAEISKNVCEAEGVLQGTLRHINHIFCFVVAANDEC